MISNWKPLPYLGLWLASVFAVTSEAQQTVLFDRGELLGYWKLDGDFRDELGGNEGVYEKEEGDAPIFVARGRGRALDLRSGQGFVELGLELGPDPKTLSFFAQTPDFEPELVWVGNRAPGQHGEYNHRFYLGSFTNQSFWGGGTQHRRGQLWPGLSPDRFYHYALVQRSGSESGGSFEIYQDGVLVHASYFSGTTESAEGRTLRIGKGGGQLTHPSLSIIDDVAVFDRALDATEIAAIAAAGSVGDLIRPEEAAPQRPNIVILLSDDLGYRDLGCYGGPVNTPTLDRLAAEGTRFTQFYSGAAVCSPSRATLLTGRHHIRAGVYSWIRNDIQDSHLLEREVTIAEALRSAGYATAHVGKWHLGLPTEQREKPTPADHGFDHWFATDNNAEPSHRNPENFIRNGKPLGQLEGYASQIVVDEAIAWLKQPRPEGQPFFLNVWFHEPHKQLAAPDSLRSSYGDPSEESSIYSATIENSDRAIARLLTALREVAPAEETLIVYSSDNGSYRRERVGELRGVKGVNWDGGIRVPGIVVWPGHVEAGKVEAEPAGLVDLFPTLCGLLGLPLPDDRAIDGADLSPLLSKGNRGDFRREQPLFWHLQKSLPIVALREGRWSLVADPDYELSRRNLFDEAWIPAIRTGGYGNFRLFDLEDDVGQETDVSEQFPEVVERLRKALLDINASVMADGPSYGRTGDSENSEAAD